MNLTVKPFGALTASELYEILRLRSEVFIVEQKGCYPDLDGIDYESIHIYMEKEDGTVDGCIRVFSKEDEPGTAQLGRLVVRPRLQGLGRALMEKAEQAAVSHFGSSRLFLTGRRSARGFYEKCGYTRQLPEGYTEETAPYYLFRKDCFSI